MKIIKNDTEVLFNVANRLARGADSAANYIRIFRLERNTMSYPEVSVQIEEEWLKLDIESRSDDNTTLLVLRRDGEEDMAWVGECDRHFEVYEDGVREFAGGPRDRFVVQTGGDKIGHDKIRVSEIGGRFRFSDLSREEAQRLHDNLSDALGLN